jgi:hypothetical protein
VAELLGFALLIFMYGHRLWTVRVERQAHDDLNAGTLYGLKQIRAALAVADRDLTRRIGYRFSPGHPLSSVYHANRTADRWAQMLERGEVILSAQGVLIRGELIPTLKPDPKDGWPAPLHECERCGFREWSEADWLKGFSKTCPRRRGFARSELQFEHRRAPALVCPNCNNIQEVKS